MKKILIILNYYYPYISGLSEYARMSAETLVARNYDVTVLTSNHDKLPSYEEINGVKIQRADILFKIGKGVISPQFIYLAAKLSKRADKVNMHLPMLESGLIALLSPKEKLVTMYHCDVNLSSSFSDRVITKVMDVSHSICLSRSKFINVTSIDYANHSRMSKYVECKLIELAAPIKEYQSVHVEKNDNYQVIGFLGRIVEEKGINILIKAYEILKKENELLKLIIGGDYLNVAGGSVFPKLNQYILDNGIKDVEFVGKINEIEMEKFFSSLDVFALPSINSLEAFGMVQLEAMRCGVPVVASDLFGVRTIIEKTGGGVICKANDVDSLVCSLKEVLTNKNEYTKSIGEIEKNYSNKIWAEKLEKSFNS